MCVCAVGSPLKEPFGMDEEFVKCGNDGQGNHHQPQYDFYAQGITEARNGLWEAVAASIKNARGKYIVTIVAILALCKVACEFLEKGSNNLSYKSIIGVLLLALMILTIGLVSLRRFKGNNAGQKEKGEKGKIKPAESGTGRISPGQDRRPST
jgi:hypothetical protein